ncbi:CDP-diacylglycerol diphosphatase, partial [Stenotrophomonas sp. 3diitr2024]
MSLRSLLLSPLLLLSACASAPPPPPVHSDALWRLIERDCQAADGPRGSCLRVEPAAGLRDV